MKQWTPEELEFLKTHYPQKGKEWCAQHLNRGEGSVRWQASQLGLRLDHSSDFARDFQARAATSKIGVTRPAQSEVMSQLHKDGKLLKTPEQKQAISERMKEWHKTHEHPKGATGLILAPEVRKRIAQKSSETWRAKSDEEKSTISLRVQKTRFANGNYAIPRNNVSWKGGKRTVGDKNIYFRSRWEANYARFLQWLQDSGQIKSWDHEPDVFWFEGVKRGSVSYLPDFRITENNGAIVYHEVKGWMDQKSKTKLNRMAKYYPDVKIILITDREYKEIARKVSRLLGGWEYSGRGEY